MIKLFNKFRLITKKSYIITIGRNISSIIYIDGDEILAYKEGDFNSPKEAKTFKDILSSNKNAHIKIILDNKEQIYKRHKIVAPASIDIESLMQDKLQEEYSEEVFRGVINLGETTDKSNNCEYLFITISKNELIQSWLDYLIQLPNNITGVYSYSLEIKKIIERLKNSYFPGNSNERANYEYNKWEILAGHSQLTGMEYFIYCNGELFLNHVNKYVDDQSAEFMAGYIENEFEVILERIKYKKEDSLDIYFITNEDVKSSLSNAKIHANNFLALTLDEINEKIGFSNNQKFNNLECLIARALSDYKSKYSLYNPEITPLIILTKIRRYLAKIMSILLVLAAACFIYLSYDISLIKDEIIQFNNLTSAENEKLIEQDSTIEEIKVLDLYSKENQLPKVLIKSINPVEYIAKLYSLKEDHIRIKEIYWVLTEDKNQPQIKLQLFIDFYNSDKKHLLSDIDKFIDKVREKFNEYDVFYTPESNMMIVDDTVYKTPIIISIVKQIGDK